MSGNLIKNRKAILVAGQSNTFWARQFGEAPVATGELDLSIKQLGRHNQDNLVPTNAGLTNIHFQQADGVRTGYAYPLAKAIKDEIECDELLIVPCAIGGTGWSNKYWTADGTLYQDMIARIRYTVEVLGYEFVGAFWSQGESDANATFSPIWHHLLHGLISTIRTVAYNAGQPNAHTIPFVTFDMVEAWVGNDPNRRAIQNALEEVGSVVPYTGNANTTNLPANLELDTIHYDTRQLLEIGNRMFSAWQTAKTNDIPNAYATAGETIVYHRNFGQYYSNIWQALESGSSPSNARYSRLGELWRYENHGKYKFKLEWVISGKTNNIIWEQNFIPHFAVQLMSAASLISFSSGAIFGGNEQMGFNGLVFDTRRNTLIKLNSGVDWWVPLGQITRFNGGIPISNIHGVKLASEVTLSVIKS
ncbi:MAG: sialate O-acetylesterase [Okeania sp. SIO2C2]|uniref:sialate O-acetylesterase n=1 Tax=Okeania sp. SIO2C2 TaxID=2607787 RepID=UPI0013B89466|nr:sialate O-acetylesterase [Okeania sp. SIO2C2]NEP87215.1 sialate O-acetylesterase [Okeania sp. SIO2C2]